MKKTIIAFAAILSIVFVTCVKNDPYVEPKGSELNGVLFLNEINGTGGPSDDPAEKYVEMYNSSDAAISLEGFIVDYAGKTSWTGRATDIVPAHGYFVIKGTKTVYPGMSTGLSANNGNVNLTLFDKEGAIVDYYEKIADTNSDPTTGVTNPLEDMDHMRIPDGGTWYYVDPSVQSPGAANLSDPTNPAVKEPMPSMEKKLTVTSVTVNPTNPTPDDDAVFLAQVTDVNTITSVVLKWKLNGAAQSDINMTKNSDGLYTATIPKQADGSSVDWTVLATNNKGNTDQMNGTIMWKAKAGDYTVLKINEVNGVGKWFEIYNSGNVAINLAGVTAYYNNTDPEAYKLTFTGDGTMTIPAKGFFSTQGITLGTGLSANNGNVKLQLRDPNGNVLDTYEKLLDINVGYDAIYGKDHARIPDGTGNWYYTNNSDGTPGATNGTSTTGYVKFGDEASAANPPVTTPDYTNLVINEIDGNGKFVELYNKGTESLSLEGIILVKNESGVWWTGAAGIAINGGEYYVVAQSGGTTVFDENTGASGISPKQTLKFELKNVNGDVIDQFVRGVSPWSTAISDVTPNSFSRCPNGTGDFKLATPSPKAANPATGDDVPQS